MFFDRGLCRHTRMIHPGQPENFVPEHASASSQNILNGVVEHVPQSQDAGDIRWRNDDGKSGLLRLRIRMEIATIQPELIPLWFNRDWVVGLGKFGHGREPSERRR